MSVRQKQCWECKNPVYTIDGRYAGKNGPTGFVPFTNRDGTPKLQEYNDIAGETAHYMTCPVKQARRAAQQGSIVVGGGGGGAQQQQQPQQQYRETSNAYVPEGYVVQPPQQIPTPPPPAAEPPILSQLQTTVEAIQTALSIIKTDQEKMNEKIDFLYRMEKLREQADENNV